MLGRTTCSSITATPQTFGGRPTMPTIHSYEDADAFLHTRGKPVMRKKVANNTYLVRSTNDSIAMLLHATYVVIWRGDTVRLETGGWLTTTTKDRINSVLPTPWALLSVKGTWHLADHYWQSNATLYRYTDGITLVRRGSGIWAPDEATLHPQQQALADDRHNAAMRKLISRYVKGLDTPAADGLNYGTNPDPRCTLCRAHRPSITPGVVSDRPTWDSIGDVMGDTQHLVDHMIDQVYSWDMVKHALSESGYLTHNSHSTDTLRRVLRKYLSRRLFVGATATHHGRRPVVPVPAGV